MSKRALVLRGLIGAAIAFFLLVGPVVGQVFGVKTDPVYQKWRMFTGKGRKVCQVHYEQVLPSGHRQTIDHLELLGWKRSKAPIRLQRKQLPALTQGVCRAVERRQKLEPDIRLTARCGSRARWVDKSQTESSVCVR